MSFSNTVYLLGSGFTKAICPEAPLNNELLDEVIHSDGVTIKRWSEELGESSDIEKLLTLIDLKTSSNDGIKKVRKSIEGEIAKYFKKFRFSIMNGKIPDWLITFGTEVLQKNDSIATLNYDCLLEGTLDCLRVWTPNYGYAGLPGHATGSIALNPKNITIYKIHGSENFGESDAHGSKFEQTGIQFEINEALFPVSGHCMEWGSGVDAKPYVIAPSFVKVPHRKIYEIMLQLLDAVWVANCLVVTGCGLRPEDTFVWQLLWRFLDMRNGNRKKLIILDPFANDIYKRISDAWIGDIEDYNDVKVVPKGLKEGIHELFALVTPQRA